MNLSAAHKFTNSLIQETSPYLLQHAHNPVNWVAWSNEVFEKAKQENKLVLISVGYSSCHWCHVMEHECFEDEDVAKIMNDFFVCMKVDREERPDVDQIYMHAVQLMTGHGGWPLNCFALPDGKPIYGGTYFPKEQWKNILLNLADLYKNEPKKIYDYAEQLLKGINHSDGVSKNDSEKISKDTLENTVKNWSKGFDNFEGGMNKAPKFPMPNNYLFLLRYAHLSKNESLLNHVLLTLDKIAFGGIYDHLGGGFARYSTDHLWKVPHFEKMLYDNAQLISLYSEAYQLTKKELYKKVVYETIEFIHREFTSAEGGFYSALDADSEGVEGKYYVWTKKELEVILTTDFPLFAEYYNVNSLGYWEEENFILLRKQEEAEIAAKFQITKEAVKATIARCKNILLTIRNQRIRPGLDDKCLASWNGMMMKAHADAYNVFGEEEFLLSSKKSAHFILNKYKKEDGRLYHSYKNGKAHINGFLEDYAFIAEGLISLYEASMEEIWLNEAKSIVNYALEHFSDTESDLLFFTSKFSEKLIARKKEVQDNVTPASNSSLAKSLFILGKTFSNPEYITKSRKMLSAVASDIPTYGSSYSNWCILMTNFVFPHYELAIVGKGVDKIQEQLRNYYLPNKIFAGSKSISSLSLLENRFVNEKTLIYVCENNTCKLPVETLKDALKQMDAED